MFIRKVEKKNRNSAKSYYYYRLVHAYKLGDKPRQQTILNLGALEGLATKSHKFLADRIEELLTGKASLFPNKDEKIEQLAIKFAAAIKKDKLFPTQDNKAKRLARALQENWQEVNMESLEEDRSADIGGEWLLKQIFSKLKLENLLTEIGCNDQLSKIAMMLLTAKMLHPSSELETERWLNENSGATELYGEGNTKVTRYQLYQAAETLYEHKDSIEKQLYDLCSGLFSQRYKIIVYDLTNLYFEGTMQGSAKAKFGRSKEKRSDCRLIGLSMAIDSLGFVRHCHFYPGNISEPDTLEEVIAHQNKQPGASKEKPVIVMPACRQGRDAGIATEENLDMLKKSGYDYLCVSRSRPKEFTTLTDKATLLTDNLGNEIRVQKVSVPDNNDTFLYIQSDQKKKKEVSMDQKITGRFEQQLNLLKQGLSQPRKLKKISAVHERIGRLKNQYSKVAKHYQITYTENREQGMVTDITWKRTIEKETTKGAYFLRYTYNKKQLEEQQIWDVYNLTREVEAGFRCLKTDLNIRPVYHQKDKWIEPHIWLGIIAYQLVNYIRIHLKEHNINYSWSTIVEKMKTQKTSLIRVDSKSKGRIYAKLCTQPNLDVKNIYNALGLKHRPYVRKLKVVTQL